MRNGNPNLGGRENIFSHGSPGWTTGNIFFHGSFWVDHEKIFFPMVHLGKSREIFFPVPTPYNIDPKCISLYLAQIFKIALILTDFLVKLIKPKNMVN